MNSFGDNVLSQVLQPLVDPTLKLSVLRVLRVLRLRRVRSVRSVRSRVRTSR